MADINQGKLDEEFASASGVYCNAMVIAIEKIKSGGKKSKAEAAQRKAEARSDRAKKAHQLQIEEVLGKKTVFTEPLVADEAEEEEAASSTFGTVLQPAYLADMNETERRGWPWLLQKQVLGSMCSSAVCNGKHSLVVLYEIEHAKAIKRGDISKNGFVVSLCSSNDVRDEIQKNLEKRDLQLVSTVSKY